MAFLKVKMDINFPKHLFIFSYIQKKFDECNTEFEYMDFVQHCLEEAKCSKNTIRQQAYKSTAYVVFSKLTGKSLESYNLTIEKCLNKKH